MTHSIDVGAPILQQPERATILRTLPILIDASGRVSGCDQAVASRNLGSDDYDGPGFLVRNCGYVEISQSSAAVQVRARPKLLTPEAMAGVAGLLERIPGP